jgi:hypothetical protein
VIVVNSKERHSLSGTIIKRRKWLSLPSLGIFGLKGTPEEKQTTYPPPPAPGKKNKDTRNLKVAVNKPARCN